MGNRLSFMNTDSFIDAITSGDVRMAARLMRLLDDGSSEALEALKALHHKAGSARVIGITGSPGVGKSTITDSLVKAYRERSQTVGVVAVDPTSPFSGGAILGDRVRMQRHATDDGVFIRSLATRGHFGGLTASTQGVVKIMDAMGKDVIIVETVGVGQDEVDVVRLADTTLVVTVPGLGDDIQAIKAGILEVADVFVVNKVDRDGAARTVRELEHMIELARPQDRHAGWRPMVLGTCALDGTGFAELLEAMDKHWAHLSGGGNLHARRKERARMELLDLIQTQAMDRLMRKLEAESSMDELVDRIAEGQVDPYSVCQQIMDRSF